LKLSSSSDGNLIARDYVLKLSNSPKILSFDGFNGLYAQLKYFAILVWMSY
jgi:hypothetical protein